jgi:hypothetical protein
MAFQPGQSGNPGGRPKTKPFADALRMELAALGEDQKALRDVAKKLITTALGDSKDSLPAIKELVDRTDGKAVQVVGGDEDAPFKVTFEWKSAGS